LKKGCKSVEEGEKKEEKGGDPEGRDGFVPSPRGYPKSFRQAMEFRQDHEDVMKADKMYSGQNKADRSTGSKFKTDRAPLKTRILWTRTRTSMACEPSCYPSCNSL
jgi:hypothetical protein